jgi:hypothetical protein
LLLREQDGDVIAIGQSSHSWLSGQLARAWGNQRFGRVEPYEEVCLAAEQHDIGFANWDLFPTYNPSTGLPQSFMEMDIGTHLQLWSAAPQQLLAQSRYAALLVSMHGCRLYEMRDLDKLPASEALAVREYLAAQRSFQRDLRASLDNDDASARAATPELVRRNSQLIWSWDYLSLAICLDWAPCRARAVPSASGPIDLKLSVQPGARRLWLDPWPFEKDRLAVRCEGRRLSGRSSTDDALRAQLATAPWETIEFELSAREP